MRQHRTIVAALCTVALLAALPLPAGALEYSFAESSSPQYYPATRYAYLYDAEYQYGGPNVIDQKIPELAYGSFSNVSTGIMDTVQDLSMGGMGLGASLTDGPVYIPSRHTNVSDMLLADGSIGTVSIPSLGIAMKVWEGASDSSMAKGLGHYSTTSGWDGNVGVCGHNRGAAYVIGSIKDLQSGDRITYTTRYGTRIYAVTFVGTIANNDWSYLQPTADNRITLTTCLANRPDVRICVQAQEVK